MRKLVHATVALFAAMTTAAYARAPHGAHMMGDNFTMALNAIEACGKLDTLQPQRHVPITSMVQHGGKVLVTLEGDHPGTIAFDIAKRRVITEGVCP